MRNTGYPENWDKIAKDLKEKAGWKCTKCGHPHDPKAGYTLTVHHIDRNPSNSDPENLLVVCQRCHLRRHAIPWIDNPAQKVMEFAV